MTDMTLENALSAIESEADNIGGEYHYVASRLCEAVESIRDHLAKAAQPVEAVDIGVGRDIVKRLRDTPNWLKEAWGDFKSAGANKYDRAPKEAADYIETLLSALAHPRPTGDAIVGSWSWLRGALSGMPSREEPIGGQRQRYLNRDEVMAWLDEGERRAGLATGANASPTGEQAGEVDGFTSEDVSNLHSLCRVLENLSKKRAPDPRDLDAEHFVTANINHAVKSATYWLPIVKGIYMRLYGALAEKARRADNEDTQPRPVGVPEGYRLVPVEPTDDMCRNVREKIGIGSNVAHHVWHWMIAAAPDGEVG